MLAQLFSKTPGAKQERKPKRPSCRARQFFESLESRQMMSTSLIPGGVLTGQIAAANQVNQYVFPATSGAEVQIDTDQSSSPGFVAQFTLRNPAGNAIDVWTGNNVRIERGLAVGQYTLGVNATNRVSSGSFAIGLEGVSPISPKPLSLANGSVVTGSVASPLDVKEYTFSPARGAEVQIDTNQSSSPGFVSQFTLYNPAGNAIDAWTGNNVRIERGLPAGQYMLKVNATNYASTGAFAIGLEGLSPISPQPLQLANGGIVNGSMASSLDVKEYVFSATGGTEMQIDTLQSSSPGFVGQFTLYNAAGNPIDAWTGNNVRIERGLPAGQYMVKVNATNYASTGTFAIGLEGLSPISPQPLLLSNGGVVSGSVASSLDVKEYAFSATGGAEMQIDTLQSSSPGFVGQFTLYNPAGNAIDAWTGNNVRIERGLPAGQYMLKVNATNYASTGLFSIGLEGLSPISPNPVALVDNGTTVGSIAAALDVKEYTLSVTGVTPVQLTTSQSSSPGFVSQFTLYNSAGNAVDAWTGNNKRIERSVPAGRYMLKVNATNYESIGSFAIGVAGL